MREVVCLLVTFAAMVSLAFPMGAAAQSSGIDCGNPFENGVGPYDYNDGEARANPSKIPIVEAGHFTSKVESLQSGESRADAMGDIDYTLRAVPNHHRALYAAVRYELRAGKPDPRFRDVTCWLERAVTFAPSDGTVRMIYGVFLAKKREFDRALEQYKRALSAAPNSAEVHYNVGLLYLDMGKIQEARTHAERAYALGYPLDGLKRRLRALEVGAPPRR